MNESLTLFLRLIVRPLRQELLRAALTVLAIGLGVAMILAIDLASESATSSFQSSLEALSGKNDFVLTETGGLDERILGDLARLPYAFELLPRIEDYAEVNGRGEAIPFLGMDLIGVRNQAVAAGVLDRKQDDVAGLWPDDVYPVWASAALHFRTGQRLQLLMNSRMTEFKVMGSVPGGGELASQQNFLVTDIGVAQQVTGKAGHLDSLFVKVPRNSGSLETWQQLLRRSLPSGVQVERQGARADDSRRMLAAFRSNLRVLSYIAVLVGGFLIYNTISISVVRRRSDIGVVRALGATQMKVLAAFLCEALLFALAGSGVGIVLGRLLAVGATALVGGTVESLYLSGHPSALHLTWMAALDSVLTGIGVSIVAALGPALEAARVNPVDAMGRGRWEAGNRQRSRYAWTGAAVLGLLGAVCSSAPPIGGVPVFGYSAVLLLILASSLVIPGILSASVTLSSKVLSRWLGVEAALALQSLRSSIGRTSILTSALMTAVAMTAAIALMVGSFRETVAVWLDRQLTADFYLRPAGSAAVDRHPTMDAALADAMERTPGVAKVDRFRAYPIVYDGWPTTFAGSEMNKVQDDGGMRFLPGENGAAILDKLKQGDYAVVSEPFSNKHHVQPGDVVHVPLGDRQRTFEVLGIFYDYSTEAGYILVDRSTLLRYLPDSRASSMAVYLDKGVSPSAVRKRLDQLLNGQAILLFANGALRRGAIQLFDQTFRITYALEVVAVIVAVLGIAGALLALVIDRRREFALLRFLGAEQFQIRRIVLWEAGIIGLIANVQGLLLGTLLSLILIFVINKQSFGWTIQFHWPLLLLGELLTGIFVATVLAGLYPARVALLSDPAEAIHEE